MKVEELVLCAQNGDSDAYTKLMLNIRNDLYKICKIHLIDDNEIDDVIQETIIQTYKNIKKLHNPSKFKAWIITILINNCNKVYREKQKIQKLNSNNYFTNIINSLTSKNDIENIEDSINFYQLLKILDYEEKMIIILYYSERFTFREISKMLKINENTVKTKLYRAKEKIKKDYIGDEKNG